MSYDDIARRLVRLSVQTGYPSPDPNPFPKFYIWRSRRRFEMVVKGGKRPGSTDERIFR